MKIRIFVTLMVSFCLFACGPNTTKDVEGETQEQASSQVEPVKASNKGIIGTWKVVDFVDNLQGVKEDVKKGGEEVARSSVYYIQSDSSYMVKSKMTPEGDDGKWKLLVAGSDTTISFNSSQEKYRETYRVKYLGHRMEWVKEIKDMGSYSMILIRQ